MRSRAGFTLLEVLAASAVVGFVFTVLASWNIQGLRAEGTASRRLEASLLADRVLSDLEAGLLTGTAPQVGRDENEVEGFAVVVEVAPLPVVLADLPPEVAGSPTLGGEPSGPTLLSSSGGGGAVTPLRHVRIEVGWMDGTAEERVVRDTFVFDAASVASTLEGISTPGTGDPGGDGEGGDEDEDGREEDG